MSECNGIVAAVEERAVPGGISMPNDLKYVTGSGNNKVTLSSVTWAVTALHLLAST